MSWDAQVVAAYLLLALSALAAVWIVQEFALVDAVACWLSGDVWNGRACLDGATADWLRGRGY